MTSKIGRLREWLNSAWDLYDVASKIVTAAPLVAAAVAGALSVLGHWGRTETLWPNWLVVGLGVAAVGSVLAAGWRLVAVLRAAKRPPFNVYDTALGHMWRLNITPAYWIEQNLSMMGPAYVDSILAGPFHAAHGCAAPLFTEPSRGSEPAVTGRCDRCRLDTPISRVIEQAQEPLSQRTLQRMVLDELQRLHRNGETIRQGLKFRLFQ